jgi:putative hydrolase of the HAD superfamily
VVGRREPGLDVESLVSRVLEPVPGDRAARGLRAVLKEIGVLETDAGLEAMRMYSFVGCEEFLQTFEGVQETVAQLSGRYELGVITNWSDAEEQRNKLRHLRLDSYVQHLVVSGSVGFDKPDRRIFEHALRLAGVESAEAVFVGDRLDVDIGGAQGAGMRAVWFNHWGGRLDSSGVRPDATIRRFTELPQAIEALSV